MLRRWISASDAAPMPTFTTRPRIESRRPSRWRRVRTFESLTLRMSRVSGVTRHAAATTGPARAAMPTSSTPTTRRSPCAHRRFSLFRDGIDRLGSATGYAPVKSSPLFAERGCLANSFAEEVESRAARVPVADELDLLDAPRVDHEGALDADAAHDPAGRAARCAEAGGEPPPSAAGLGPSRARSRFARRCDRSRPRSCWPISGPRRIPDRGPLAAAAGLARPV